MTEIYFVNYYQSKNHKRYKINKLLHKAMGKCRNKTPNKLFFCTRNMGMNNFGCLNSSLSLFYFYFVKNLRKNYGVSTLTAEPPSTPHEPIYFQLDHFSPPPSVRTLWITPIMMGSFYRKANLYVQKFFKTKIQTIISKTGKMQTKSRCGIFFKNLSMQ